MRIRFHNVSKMLLKQFWFITLSSLEKLAEAQRRFATLQNELQSSLDAQRESSAPPGLRKRKTMFHLSQEERCKHHNIKDLKLAFSEFYLSLILLQNYQVLSARTELSCFDFTWPDLFSFVSHHVWLLILITFLTCGICRTWTSLVSVRSWKNMIRSWTRLVEPTGVWLTWRWLLFTPARRSPSLSLRQRWLLTFPQTSGYS